MADLADVIGLIPSFGDRIGDDYEAEQVQAAIVTMPDDDLVNLPSPGSLKPAPTAVPPVAAALGAAIAGEALTIVQIVWLVLALTAMVAGQLAPGRA